MGPAHSREVRVASRTRPWQARDRGYQCGMTLPVSGRRMGAAFAFAVITALGTLSGAPLGAGPAPQVPPLPIALLASFDEAFALVSDAAEQRIAELEQRSELPRRSPSPCVAALLTRIERDVTAACADARVALCRAFETVALSPARRASVLASIDRQLAEAHRARAGTSDPAVRLEYSLTCTHLRAIRALV